MKNFATKEQALEYCFSQIKQSIIGKDDYNKLKQYMYRHRNGGKLKDTAISTLFDYFEVREKCTYHVDDKSKNQNDSVLGEYKSIKQKEKWEKAQAGLDTLKRLRKK